MISRMDRAVFRALGGLYEGTGETNTLVGLVEHKAQILPERMSDPPREDIGYDSKTCFDESKARIGGSGTFPTLFRALRGLYEGTGRADTLVGLVEPWQNLGRNGRAGFFLTPESFCRNNTNPKNLETKI